MKPFQVCLSYPWMGQCYNGTMVIWFSINHRFQRTALSLPVLREVNKSLASISAQRIKLNMVSVGFNAVSFRFLFVSNFVSWNICLFNYRGGSYSTGGNKSDIRSRLGEFTMGVLIREIDLFQTKMSCSLSFSGM